MNSKSFIINSPYERPMRWWEDYQGQLRPAEGRRPAAYEIFDPRANTKRSAELELVNRIRERVDAWRDAEYPGVTNITRELLRHWHDRSARQHPLFFCQLEAIETLIWWVEAPPNAKQGIHVPGDGGPFERICNKMATGSGKTRPIPRLVYGCLKGGTEITCGRAKATSHCIAGSAGDRMMGGGIAVRKATNLIEVTIPVYSSEGSRAVPWAKGWFH